MVGVVMEAVDIIEITASGIESDMNPPVIDGMITGKMETTVHIMMITSPKRNGKSTGKSALIMKKLE